MASKTLLVAQREYLENIRTKTFWLGILAFPAIFAIAIGVGWLMNATKKTQVYTVVDGTESGLGAQIEANARANAHIDALRSFLRSMGDEEQWLERLEQVDVTDPASLETLNDIQGQASQSASPEQIAKLEEKTAALAKKYRFAPLSELGLAELDREAMIEQLNDQVREGELFGYFVLDNDPVTSLYSRDADDKPVHNLSFVSKNTNDDTLSKWYGDAATRVIQKKRIAAARIDPRVAKHIRENVSFKAEQPSETGAGRTDVEAKDRARNFAPVVFVYLLWIAIFTAAQMLLTNTVEEKSNRIIEVLLSSCSPRELMAGKIWGIGATGLTMIVSWAVFGVIGMSLGAKVVPMIADLNLLDIASDPLYLASFIGYFFTGYLLFAAMLVAIGSVCNSLKEAQNLVQPVFLLLMIPLFAMVPVVQEPNGLMAKVFTYIPLYTPFAMMNRASGPPAAWEYVVTTIMILVSVWFAFRAAGKVFRVGVLMTGNPPKLKEILGWLKES